MVNESQMSGHARPGGRSAKMADGRLTSGTGAHHLRNKNTLVKPLYHW